MTGRRSRSGMMLMVLYATNTPKLARYTGIFAGSLVALYITFEAPLSGMSINPARTIASALPSGIWTAAWMYFVAPVGGMLLAGEIYWGLHKGARIACAKWNHDIRHRCIFCGHPAMKPSDAARDSGRFFIRGSPDLRPICRMQRSGAKSETMNVLLKLQ